MQKSEKGIVFKEYTNFTELNKNITSTFMKTEPPSTCVVPDHTPVTVIINSDDVYVIEKEVKIVQLENLVVGNNLNIENNSINEFNCRLHRNLKIPRDSYINLIFNDFFSYTEIFILVDFFFKSKKAAYVRIFPHSLFVFTGLGITDGIFVDNRIKECISFITDFVQFSRLDLREGKKEKVVYKQAEDYTSEYRVSEPVFICNLCNEAFDDIMHLKKSHFVSGKCVCGKNEYHDDHFSANPSKLENKLKVLLQPAGENKSKIFEKIIIFDIYAKNEQELKINNPYLENEKYFDIKNSEIIFLQNKKKPEEIDVNFSRGEESQSSFVRNENIIEEENVFEILDIYKFSFNIMNMAKIYGELFISKKEWDLLGIRVLKERNLFIE